MEHPSQFSATLRRDNSHFSSPAINRWGDKRNSFGGSTSSLNSKSYLQVPGVNMRRNSRNYSTDSLDLKRNSWDPGRRGSAGSWLEDPIWEQVKIDYKKTRRLGRVQFGLSLDSVLLRGKI
ncbi:hypothetical protein YQE_06394, partial [Dendroctonus ponderosae]